VETRYDTIPGAIPLLAAGLIFASPPLLFGDQNAAQPTVEVRSMVILTRALDGHPRVFFENNFTTTVSPV